MREETPPVQRGEMPDSESLPRWAKVIGIISLFYASFGLMCSTTIAGFMGFAQSIPKMFRGGIDYPPIIRILDGGLAIVGFGIAVLLLVGAINLLRRRRGGVSQLKKWVILRLVMLLVGVVTVLATMPHRADMVKQQVEFENEMRSQGGRPFTPKEITDEAAWSKARMQTMVFALIVAIYPTFLGFYLSRHKIDDQVRAWD